MHEYAGLTDELATMRGTLETPVRGLQHDSASRVATPSRVIALEDNRANLVEPNLLSSSSNAVLMTISGMKKLIAENFLTLYGPQREAIPSEPCYKCQ